MKRLIVGLLSNGYTKSKKSLNEFTRYLYVLDHILVENELGMVVCNDNSFWKEENNKNREELIHDIDSISRRDIRDGAYFHIINRFEHGDKYGIEAGDDTHKYINNMTILAEKYGFSVRKTKVGADLVCKNTDGQKFSWIKLDVAANKVTYMGNTDQCNLWFYETRPDLKPERIIEFVKDLNSLLEMEPPFLLRELIDPEDWQEIAGVCDASADVRWSRNVFGNIKATDIKWDTDQECPIPLILPTTVNVPEGMFDEEEISDWLSKEFGFCHFGFKLKEDVCTNS